MALVGTGKVLGDKIAAKIIAPDVDAGAKADIIALWESIGNVIVDHLIANSQVLPGIPVATAGSPTAQTGATTGPVTLT
jgi:hypothetical protein